MTMPIDSILYIVMPIAKLFVEIFNKKSGWPIKDFVKQAKKV